MSKSIKLFVLKKWLSNKTCHKIDCFSVTKSVNCIVWAWSDLAI